MKMNKTNWIFLSLNAVALIFQIHSWYMDSVQHQKTTNPERIKQQMNHDQSTIKRRRSPYLDIKPAFKVNFDVKVEDFDLIINTSTGDEFDDVLSAGIWKYSPGEYALTATPDGQDVLETIRWQLDDILTKNRENNNIVIEVEAIGSADALRYNNEVYYDGRLGNTLEVRYFKCNEPDIPLDTKFTKGKTRMTNELLALLRALDAVIYFYDRNYIDPENIKIFVREFDRAGPEYRRLDLQITLRNAFLKDYNELNFAAKLFDKMLR
jgi:hypothetical protein